MKTFKNLMLMLTLVFSIASCSSDDDNNDNTVNNSREVKYEVTGNFTGETQITYIEKGGAPLIEDGTLPWTKEFTAEPKCEAVLVHASGGGGLKGQTITAKVIVGGEVVSELTGTANNDGIIVVHPTTYVFPK